ncbi:hypothetical protein [Paraburkholderia sp. SIMBA_030]|uniref:hypothetical protein n=1 Tax=Paraburkholderia sp. SIMBA_030 TaxID=3085773 RepID=UPI00397927F9
MKKAFRLAALLALIFGAPYFIVFDHTPPGTDCKKSSSPDGSYTAELCMLKWYGRGNAEYVGRVFDAGSGKLLAQHTFITPVPTIMWSDYEGESVLFSIGDGGDKSTYVDLPPSKWDRLLAARPRL